MAGGLDAAKALAVKFLSPPSGLCLGRALSAPAPAIERSVPFADRTFSSRCVLPLRRALV